jgi:hypothetical protein
MGEEGGYFKNLSLFFKEGDSTITPGLEVCRDSHENDYF